MAREGGTVVCVDNHPERLDAAVEALTCRRAGAWPAVRRAGSGAGGCRRDCMVKEFGRIDILVNAVGGSTIIAKPSATVEEHSLDDWQRVIKFNLNGTFLFTHAVVPIMKMQKCGKDRQSCLDRRTRHERRQSAVAYVPRRAASSRSPASCPWNWGRSTST